MKKFFYQKMMVVAFMLALSLSTCLSFAQQMTYTNLRDGNGIEVSYSIKDFNLESLNYKGEEMQEISISGISIPNDAGMPNLPRISRYIAVPQGATAKVTINSMTTSVIQNVNIAPALKIQAENEEPNMDYVKNEMVYSTNKPYPATPVEVSEHTSLRGVDAVILGITPFQYNPVTKELTVISDIDVDVEFIGGNNHYGDDKYRSLWFDPILKNAFLNYEALPEIDYSTRSRDGEGCEYLIVIPNDPAWLPYAEQIKEWRTKQGILTHIVSLADMGASSTAQIKNYLHNAYNNWDIPPVAVLLMADHGTNLNNYIPAESISHPYSGSCITDNQYADVTGDKLPEMVFARMVASNTNELNILVSKVLEYESNPCMEENYYHKPITALGWQTERWFQLCSEVVGGYYRSKGKDPVRINCIYSGTPGSTWSSNQNTSAVVSYFGPNGINYIPNTPSELGGWTGGTPQQIVDVLNADGAFIVQHRDHGLEDGWGEPAFRSSHVNQLTNVGKLTYVFSINCLTGKFDLSSKCFGENFILRQYNGQNAGAVGILCPTEVSYSFVNDTYVWGVNDLFDPDFLPGFGPYAENSGNFLPAFGNVSGKYFLAQSSWPYNSDDKEITFQMFTAHSDAFLRIYTEVPQELNVAYVPTIIAGSASFSISCDEGAMIALTVDGEIIGVAEATGAYQNIDIPSTLIPTTEITVVCTKQNYLRYEGVATVVPAEGAYVIGFEWNINDANADGILEYGESATIDMTAKNVGVEEANNVVLTISSTSEYITITDNTANFGTIAADATVTVNNAFALTVSEAAPNNQLIPIAISATDGTDTWASNMSFRVYRPILEYAGFSWPGMYAPGETYNLSVSFTNDGGAPVEGVIGTISSSYQYVTLNNTTANFGTIAPDGTVSANFSVTIDEDAPGTDAIDFHVEAAGDNGTITAAGDFSIANSCNVIFNLADSYGDGWNGASLNVTFDDGTPSQNMTISSGSSATYTVEINIGTNVTVSFTSGSWNSECSFNIQYEDGTMIYQSSGTPQAGVQCTFLCDCGNQIPEPCDPVTNLVAVVDATTVDLTWDGGDATFFTINRDGVQIANNVTNESYTDENVVPGDHNYCVFANYQDGCVSVATCTEAVVTINTCNPVLDLEYEVDDYYVSISWIAPEGDVTGYNVYRDNEMIETVTTIYFSEFVENGNYNYCVEAFNDDATAAQVCIDVEVNVTCAPVADLVAVVNESDVTVSWSTPEGNVAFYEVYRDGTLLTETTETSYEEDLQTNASYEYCVIVTMTNGCVSEQACVDVEVSFQAPVQTLTATKVDDNSVQLEWTLRDGNYGTVVGYQVYCLGELITTATEMSFTHTDVPYYNMLNYCVKVVYENNLYSEEVCSSIEMCAAIKDLTIEVITNDVTLAWTAPEDAASFSILRDNISIATVEEPIYADVDVAVGEHSYTVFAVYTDCNSNELQGSAVITGISDVENMKIYPNPANDNVFIYATGIQTVNVYNNVGQLMFTKSYSSVNEVTVNTADLESGLYFFDVKTADNGSVRTRIVVKH
ncbi:MAG: C25 family cysteine peptidase [Bacteroidales bacterium]|nr:C25 family cysteine peptidase [Bacteroidales bacterium]MDD3151660.1 C25 family cysteine peptidase [Bacteroidales bacterium]MDD3914657.1 C25 family cysteine peptidase [Bacteroidales bacterium]MDD4634496.1 C25 family cysteine peptidase [Bacteroidales bacterium]